MSITNTNSYVVETSYKMQEVIADATTNQALLFAIDISDLQCFSMSCTQDMTVYTNDAGTGSPQETFNMLADQPVIFESGIDSAIFAGDITSFYVTNASGSDATFNVIAAIDATP